MKKVNWVISPKSTNISIANTTSWICSNGQHPYLEISNCGGNVLYVNNKDIYFNPKDDFSKYGKLVGLNDKMTYQDAVLRIADYLCSVNECIFS